MEIGSLKQIIFNEDHDSAICSQATSVYKHLILSKIAPNHYSASHWSDEIDIYSERLKHEITTGKKGQEYFRSKDLKTLEKEFSKIYNNAKKEVRKETQSKYDPIPFDQIPPDPEWSINDILTKDKTELIPGIDLGGRRRKKMEREEQEARINKNKKKGRR